MGLLLISSINNRDIVTVQAEVTLIACAIVAANLLADVLYMVLDPRIRHGRIAS
jgi:peptide/nickel transport system permease protein